MTITAPSSPFELEFDLEVKVHLPNSKFICAALNFQNAIERADEWAVF
jgi:hypothetical protein